MCLPNPRHWKDVRSSSHLFFAPSFFSWPLRSSLVLLLFSYVHVNDQFPHLVVAQVCLQEAGEEEDQEEEGGDDGDHGEADLAEDQLSLRGQPRLCLRDEGRPLSW